MESDETSQDITFESFESIPERKALPKPREYQLHAINFAIKQNSIVFLDTGSGKTYIAILLIKWMFNESIDHSRLTTPKKDILEYRKVQKKYKAFFVVNTTSLLHQQANTIKKQTLLKVGKYHGNQARYSVDPEEWRKEFKNKDVFVIMGKILLENLRHGLVNINQIDLLIFDECHHAGGNHDYNSIMKEFYFNEKNKGETKLPKVLGLTASPIKGKVKGGDQIGEIKRELQTLSNNLDAAFCPLTKELLKETESYSSNKLASYGGTTHLSPTSLNALLKIVFSILKEFYPSDPENQRLIQEEYKNYLTNYAVSTQVPNAEELFKINRKLTFYLLLVIRKGYSLLLELGIQAFIEFLTDLKEDLNDNTKLMESCVEVLRADVKSSETLYTTKLIRTLHLIWEKKQELKHLSLILFAREKIVCIYLHKLLGSIPTRFTFDYIYGNKFQPTGNYKKLQKSVLALENEINEWVPRFTISFMNPTRQRDALDKFKSNATEVLIATQVIEEGLDVISCNVIIAYNMLMNVKSFIQMKGRARAENSEFIVMVHETERVKIKNELENLITAAENMRLIGTIEEMIVPEFYNFSMNPNDYIEILETKAKVCKQNAKEYLEAYCQGQRNGDKYLNVLPQYVVVPSLSGGYCGSLRLPAILNQPPIIDSKNYFTKKECENSLAFQMVKQLVNAGKIDKHLFPTNKKSVLKEKKEKVMKYLKENEKFKQYKREKHHLFFPNCTYYYNQRTLFREVPYETINEFYLQIISLSPGIPNNGSSEHLAILHSVPIIVQPFKIATANFANKEITRDLLLNINTPPKDTTENMHLVSIKPEASLKLSHEQYHQLKLFYVFMLHIINSAVAIFIEGDKSKDKVLRVTTENKNATHGILQNSSCHLLVVPIIDSGSGKAIDWETVRNVINYVEGVTGGSTTLKDIVNKDKIRRGYVVLESKTKVPRAVSGIDYNKIGKTVMENERGLSQTYTEYFSEKYQLLVNPSEHLIKLHMLPSVKEAALIPPQKNCYMKVEHKNSRVIHLPLELCQHFTGIPWQVYLNFTYIPSILTIVNEKLRFKELAQYNIEKFGKESAINWVGNADKYAELLEHAFTAKSAQRGLDYERLELLGDTILKLVVTHYLYKKYPGLSEGELSIKKYKKVDNNNLMQKSVHFEFYKHMRLDPLFVKKEPMIPGMSRYYKNYLSDTRLSKAYTLYKSASSDLQKITALGLDLVPDKEVQEYVKHVNNTMKSNYNTYCQLQAAKSDDLSNPDVKKISFKQLADIFESSIGALYLTYGLSSCYYFLDLHQVIKLRHMHTLPQNKCDAKVEQVYTKYGLMKVETDILKYTFNDKAHLVSALAHPSYLESYRLELPSYQRYEFLGDAVIEFLVTKYFFHRYEHASPGMLTELKFAGLNNNLFAFISIQSGLFRYLLQDCFALSNDIELYREETKKNGPRPDLDSVEGSYTKVLADILESIIGAVYIDSGEDLEKTLNVFSPLLFPYLEIYATPEYCKQHRHPKTILTEFLAKYRINYKDSVKIKTLLSKEGRVFIYQGYFQEILIEQRLASHSNKVVRKLFMKNLCKRVIQICKEFEEQEGEAQSLKTITKKYQKIIS